MKSIKSHMENCNGKEILKKYYHSEKNRKKFKNSDKFGKSEGSRKSLGNSENSD